MTRRCGFYAVMLMGLLLIGDGVYLLAKAELAQVLMQRAWGKAQAGNPVPPWPWADTHPVGRLVVSGHGIDQIILAGASGRNLAFGPSFLLPSAAPGAPGNTVIAGHRDTHFEFLENLEVGDQMSLEWMGQATTSYTVMATRIVDSRFERLDLDGSASRLTLVTCYPFDAMDPGGPLRFVVEAYPNLDRLNEFTAIRHGGKPDVHKDSTG